MTTDKTAEDKTAEPDRDTGEARRQRLAGIVRARSLHTGSGITLASGRRSTFYFDMKATMLDPEGAYLAATLILETVADLNPGIIGGLEMGAVPVAAAVAALSYRAGRPLPAFFVRKAAKAHGTQRLIEGLAAGESLAGKRVIVVEDVTTTGRSALEAAEAVRAAGGIVVCAVAIVDREEGAESAFASAGVPFRAVLRAADMGLCAGA